MYIICIRKHFVNLNHNVYIFFLRVTEIAQFMKRFPSYEVIEEKQSFAFTFQPSDPDWVCNLILLLLLLIYLKTEKLLIFIFTIIFCEKTLLMIKIF